MRSHLRQSIAVLCALLWLAVPSFSQSKAPEGNRTAEITKIDAKKKSLQVKEVVEPTSSRNGQGNGRRGGNGGGGNRTGTGGGRRTGGTGRYPGGGGGVGFPGGGGSGRYPGGGGGGGTRPGTSTNQPKEYKVFVTKDTEMKLFGTTKADFSDFRVGDRITFSGNPHGKSGDVEAMTLSREN